jgi:type IV fimbrial biogenesis protein FimT
MEQGRSSYTDITGFTLPELLIVLLITSILLSIGIPSFRYVTTANRISSEVNGLLGDMQYARSEAIKQGLPVTVCASTNQTQCDGGAAPAWQHGWITFLDTNGNQQVDAGEAIIRAQVPFSSTDTFLPDNGTFGAVTFNREGYANTHTAAIVTLELHNSGNVSQWTRCVAITPVGMVNTQKAGMGNCS